MLKFRGHNMNGVAYVAIAFVMLCLFAVVITGCAPEPPGRNLWKLI